MAMRVTDEEARAWVELYLRGMTYEQISLEVNRSAPTIRRHVSRISPGISRPKNYRSEQAYIPRINAVDGKPKTSVPYLHHSNFYSKASRRKGRI